MRRLLCNQVSVALVGIVLQIIIFNSYHEVECQPALVKPIIKKIVPLVSSSYKKLSKTLLKTLSELPIDEQILFKKKAEIASDPVVGSAKSENSANDGVKIIDRLHKTGKFVDNLVDGLFSDSGNLGNKLDGGDNPVVGSAKDGGGKGGYGVKIKDRLVKTGKFVDNLVDGFFSESGNSAKNVDSGADPVVGSARDGGLQSNGGTKGYGKRIGNLFDNFMDRFLTYPVNPGNDGGSADDPVVGSAKGAGNQETYGRHFEGTLGKTGKLFDQFMGEVLTDPVNSDNAADPVVGSAKGDAVPSGTGPKFEHRFKKTGKVFDIFMDGLFGGLESEDTNAGDGGSDPVVGSARDAGGTDEYGGHFEGALHETGKFADMFMKDILRRSGNSENVIGTNSVDDPVVGSPQGGGGNGGYNIKLEDYLRKTGTYFDKFLHGVLGGFEKAGGKTEYNTVDDSLVGSANPNAEEVSTDVAVVTEAPTNIDIPKPDELSKDLETDTEPPLEQIPKPQGDEEIFIDLEERLKNRFSKKPNGARFGSLLAKKPPNHPFLKKVKLHVTLPVKVINPKFLKPKAKRQLVMNRFHTRQSPRSSPFCPLNRTPISTYLTKTNILRSIKTKA